MKKQSKYEHLLPAMVLYAHLFGVPARKIAPLANCVPIKVDQVYVMTRINENEALACHG